MPNQSRQSFDTRHAMELPFWIRAFVLLFALGLVPLEGRCGDGYVKLGLGTAMYGGNGPKEYFDADFYKTRGFPLHSSLIPLTGQISIGYWFAPKFGLDIKILELGPYAAILHRSEDVYESHLYGGSFVSPQGRMKLLSESTWFIIAFPTGAQYLYGHTRSTVTTGVAFAYGLESRIEHDFDELVFLSLSVSYIRAVFPKRTYTGAYSLAGNSSVDPNFLNKKNDINREIDLSGPRISLGLGLRWANK